MAFARSDEMLAKNLQIQIDVTDTRPAGKKGLDLEYSSSLKSVLWPLSVNF